MRKSLVGVNCTRLGLTELKLDPHHGLSVVAAPLPPGTLQTGAALESVDVSGTYGCSCDHERGSSLFGGLFG